MLDAKLESDMGLLSKLKPVLCTFLLMSVAASTPQISFAARKAKSSCVVNAVSATLNEPQQFRFAEIKPAPNADLKDVVIISTTGIERAKNKTQLISPAVDPSIQVFLQAYGPLGYAGPLMLGPTSRLGPVGADLWHPSWWISSAPWRNLSRYLTKNGGPLNPETGVLSPISAAGDVPYREILPRLPYGSTLQEGGILMILGPKGILGPHGPLGSLSTIGATGLMRDSKTGAFKQGHRFFTRFVVSENGKKPAPELLDSLYSDEYARKLSREWKLPPSFTLDTELKAGVPETLNISVDANTWVTALVQPESFGESFGLTLLSEKGDPINAAESRVLMNGMSVRFPRQAKIQIQVNSLGPSPYNPTPFNPSLWMTGRFRLQMMEAPVDPTLNHFDGPHITVLK
jgi:hypothetical protein